MDRVSDVPVLEGWIPIRLYWQDQQPMVDWCFLGANGFTDPFFNQTVEDCLRLPFNLIFRHQTPLELLRQRHELQPGLRPTGFIFHMSRCGSTLLSQMLAALSSNIVISEAPLLDSALGSDLRGREVTEDRRVEWLRWLISALGQPRLGNERHFFIKFDAWNILYFPLIRQAFPDVPWVFLYRDPIEVMVSQLSHRGAHMIPGVIAPELFGMDMRTAISWPPDDYCAKVLATICQGALQHYQNGGQLINYTQLPDVVWTSVLDFFGVSCNESEIDTIRGAAKQDAKNPFVPFASDSKSKQQKATLEIRAAAGKWLYPVYEKLEAARVGHGSPHGGAQKGAAQFKDDLTQKIAAFLKEIGLEIISTQITSETFLPGILVAQGKLLIDEDKLLWPGDLLHEAGHLAVAPAQLRPTLTGEVILPDANLDAIESQAIAWSYAASLHLGLDPKTVFHEGGYRGQSAALLMNFEIGVPLGVNGLQEAGMAMIENAARQGVRPYPHMLKWLRD